MWQLFLDFVIILKCVHFSLHTYRHHMDDIRSHHSQFSGNGAGNAGYDHTGANAGNIKTSSAFSPIQGSMLQASAASGFMRGYSGTSFYDPIGFPKHHSQVCAYISFR